MLKKRRTINREEARKNAIELLNDEFESVLVATNHEMIFNGDYVSYLATLGVIIENAYNKCGIPKELVESTIELALNDEDEEEDEEETDKTEEKKNKNSLEDEINKKMVEILDLMKEEFTK